MDTLQNLRRLKRYVDSQNRKMLKKRMREYDVLSSGRAGAGSHVATQASQDTIHDIIQELHSNMEKRTPHNRVMRRASRVDTITRSVVSDEVRSAWRLRTGLVSEQTTYSDEVRSKLIQQASSRSTLGTYSEVVMRNMYLDNLAKTLVTKWCDTDGYNPALHTTKAREKHESGRNDMYISPVIF